MSFNRFLILFGLLFAASMSSYAQVTLNFQNAEIEAVSRTIATLTKRNVVVDPRVKGTMNLSTEKPVSAGAAFNQFLSALRLQGYTVVESGGLYKVVPEADAKLQGGDTTVIAPGEKSGAAGNQIVTQIFKLNFESANNLVPILRPLIAPNNTINVNPGSNSLVITDYQENLSRLARIIAALDVSNATDLEIIPVKSVAAADIAPLLTRLLESGGSPSAGAPAGQADTSFKTTVVAEPRSNSLIVRAANPARLVLVKSLISQLDQPSSNAANGAMGNIYVVYLKNAEAIKLAVTLRAALQANTIVTSGNSAVVSASPISPNVALSAQPSTGGQIQADPATNSLIITASEPQYRQLRAVIDRLDARRAQVYVESMIVEVNATKAAQFGVQWQSVLNNNGNSTVGVLGTNFGTGGNNILGLGAGAASGSVTPGTGLNVGVANKVNGQYVLGFLANFLETNADGNILSTPNLLTLDNEEAKIVIGQNVPFVTGQYTNATSSGATNPFQTIERKDVGLTLKVKPQISENGTVRLTIFQEVSNVDSTTSASGLITNKRSLESNVLVEDGGIVMLGGLLSDASTNSQNRVPGLASIPFFGALFRSESKSRVKTNLMVFLRPVVVRDGAAVENYSLTRYDEIRSAQQAQQAIRDADTNVTNFGAPLLPEKKK